MSVVTQTQDRLPTVLPPRGARLRFWFLSRRLDAPNRPWVAEQLQDPLYARRRARYQLLVLLPAMALLLSSRRGQPWHLGLILLGALIVALPALLARPVKPHLVARLLAYHGATADGRAVTPVASRNLMPRGMLVLTTFYTATLVLVVGAYVVVDHLDDPARCHAVDAADLAAINGFVGVPNPNAVQPERVVPRGSVLRHPRSVRSLRDGYVYVAASVDRVGPAVWEVLHDGSKRDPYVPLVANAGGAWLEITPSAGTFLTDGVSGDVDDRVAKALACTAG